MENSMKTQGKQTGQSYEDWMMDKAAKLLDEKRSEIRSLKQQVADLSKALHNEQMKNA